MTLLEVRDLATGYGDIRAVWDVSLQVAPGEVTVLLGRNGAGKTTTLRAVAGLNRADAGSITFDGRDITGLPAHRRVGAGIGSPLMQRVPHSGVAWRSPVCSGFRVIPGALLLCSMLRTR